MYNQNNYKITSDELSLALSHMILTNIKEFSNNPKEMRELIYFYIHQIDRMLMNFDNKYAENTFDNIVFETISLTSNITQKSPKEHLENIFLTFRNEYNIRTDIYSKCLSFMGDKGSFHGKGTSILALSYFLKYASNKTSIELEYIKDVLSGKSNATEENMSAFFDFTEIIKLQIKLSVEVLNIQKFINEAY